MDWRIFVPIPEEIEVPAEPRPIGDRDNQRRVEQVSRALPAR